MSRCCSSRRAPRHKRRRRAVLSFLTPRRSWRPGSKATLLPDGTAAAPADAPPQVQAAIFAANKLLDKPYKYGGGHAKVEDSGYDCSGTVSYALLAAKLLKTPARLLELHALGPEGQGHAGSRSTRTRATPSPSSPACAWTRARGGDHEPQDRPHRRARPALARRPAQRRAASRSATRVGLLARQSGSRWQLVALGEPVAPARLRLALAPHARPSETASSGGTSVGRPSSSSATIVR